MDFAALLDPSLPLGMRLKLFNDGLSEFGALDAQTLSNRMRVRPQVVTAYYELNDAKRAELGFLEARKLDIPLLEVLMNMSPPTREAIYSRLDEFLQDPHPVHRIVEFVNLGAGKMTIKELFEQADRKFWPRVSALLKAMNIDNGTLNRGLRSMLVAISIRGASKGQLEWLERAIRQDADRRLGIFTGVTLKRDFPQVVESIERFLA